MPKSETPPKLPEQADQPLSLSLWAQYRHEMHGIETLERQYGFLSFKVDREIGHIVDVYITPQMRSGNARRELFNETVEILKSRGVNKVVGNVEVLVKGSTRRLRFWLMIGAEVYQATNNVIYFTKSI